MPSEHSTGRGSRRQQKIWPIEARMKADMAARDYTPLTQRVYVRAVRHLSRHYAWRNPELISVEEAQCYLRLKRTTKISASALTTHAGGIRFLFQVILLPYLDSLRALRGGSSSFIRTLQDRYCCKIRWLMVGSGLCHRRHALTGAATKKAREVGDHDDLLCSADYYVESFP